MENLKFMKFKKKLKIFEILLTLSHFFIQFCQTAQNII